MLVFVGTIFGAIISGIVAGCSAIVSGITTVCSAVGGALAHIGGVAKSIVGVIQDKLPVLFPGKPLPDLVEDVGRVVKTVAETVQVVNSALNDSSDIGMAAELAEKRPEDFDSTVEYIDYLNNDVSIDEEKKKNLTPEEKAAYSAIGSALYIEATEEKIGVEKGFISAEILVDCVKLKADADEIVEHFKQLSNKGVSTKDMSDYLHKNSSDIQTQDNVKSALQDSFKELYPDMSDDDIADKIGEMRDAVVAVEQ